MVFLWRFLYNVLAVPSLYGLFYSVSLFNHKVRTGIRERRGLLSQLRRDLEGRESSQPRVWFHAASAGEFEQVRPVCRALLAARPDLTVIVSFFSPSGYHFSRSDPAVHAKTYLPFDSPRSVRRFLDTLQPAIAIFDRYDLWPNMLAELGRRRVPALLMNASFLRKPWKAIWPLSRLYAHLYDTFDRIAVVSDGDAEGGARYGVKDSCLLVTGDTRFDRVAQRRKEALPDSLAAVTENGERWVIVGGSTWPEDESLLLDAVSAVHDPDSRPMLILVPHEPTPVHVVEISGRLRTRGFSFSLLTEVEEGIAAPVPVDVLVVNKMGMLANVYRLGRMAHVGGAFGAGVHNVLEPAVYGLPIMVGPRLANSVEARELRDLGGLEVVRDAEDARRMIELFVADEKERQRRADICREYVTRNLGASERVAGEIVRLLDGQGEID